MANFVEVILAGKDNLSGPMGSASRALMAAGAAVAALGAAAGVSLRTFANFESSIARIEGLSNTGKDTLAKWKDEILKLAPALGQTPQALADAMFFISSAGLSSAAAMDVLKAAASASSAGLGDLTSIAKTAISALNAYGENNLSASRAVDIMVAAVREGNVETTEFAGSLGRVLPIASKLGVSMDEVSGSIAAMTNIGLDANESVTALRGILNAILGPSEQAVESLGAVGGSFDTVRVILREKGEGGGLLGALDYLMTAANGDIEVLNRMFPEIRGLTGLFALLGENADKTRKIIDATSNSFGSYEKALEAVSETLQFKFNQASANFQVALIKIGESLKPEAIAVLERFTKALPTITADAIALIKGFGSAISFVGDAFLSLPVIIQEVGIVLALLGGAKARIAVIVGLSVVKLFMELGEAVAGLFSGDKNIASLDKEIGNLNKELSAMAQRLREAKTALSNLENQGQGNSSQANLLRQLVSNLEREYDRTAIRLRQYTRDLDESKKVQMEFNAAGKPTIDLLKGFASLWEGVDDEVQEFSNRLEIEGQQSLGAYLKTMERLAVEMDDMAQPVSEATNNFKDFFDGFKLGAREILAAGGALGDFKDIGQRLGSDIAGAFRTGLGDTIFSVFKGETDKLKDVWNKFTDDLLRSFSKMIADMILQAARDELWQPFLSLAGKAGGSLLSALPFALGGLVTKKTFGVLGEAGPELVIPLNLAGKFIQDAIVQAARNQAAKDVVIGAGIPEGTSAAQASASAITGAVTGAALFAMFDAINVALGGQSTIRAIGDLVFGERGPGLLQKGLGALGISAFRGGGISPEAHGAGNVWQIEQMLIGAVANFGELGIRLQRLIDISGGNPNIAENIIRKFIGGRQRISEVQGGFFGLPLGGEGDRVGRYYPQDVIRLLHAGETTLNPDSEPSIRGLSKAIERAGGGRGMNITVQIIEPQISMEADLDRIAEMAAMKIGRKLNNPFFNLSSA